MFLRQYNVWTALTRADNYSRKNIAERHIKRVDKRVDKMKILINNTRAYKSQSQLRCHVSQTTMQTSHLPTHQRFSQTRDNNIQYYRTRM